MLGQISLRQQVIQEAKAVLIEGLPENYNQLMLQELVRAFPGLQEYSLKAERQSAVVVFGTHEEAKVALSGMPVHLQLFLIGLHRFRVDQEGSELRASFFSSN